MDSRGQVVFIPDLSLFGLLYPQTLYFSVYTLVVFVYLNSSWKSICVAGLVCTLDSSLQFDDLLSSLQTAATI